MGVRRWIEEAIEISRLSPPDRFPRDLEGDARRALPVTVVPLSGLSVGAVRNWLHRRGIDHPVASADRLLHGCQVSLAGAAILFVDDRDPEAERRFTVGHEFSHHVLDHLVPRHEAIRALGEAILPVLNRERDPTPAERLHAVLSRVPLDVQVSLMARDASGGICSWRVENAEQRANALALELLAPEREALPMVKAAGDPRSGAEALAARFGIPAARATDYADRLLRALRPRSSVLHLFGRD